MKLSFYSTHKVCEEHTHLKVCVCVHRKQCIELEQQFDFLKDLVATVPDMQGEGEENHTEGGGEKVPRRYISLTHTHLFTLTVLGTLHRLVESQHL